MTAALGYLQALIGLVIVVGGLALGLAGTDKHTSKVTRAALTGLVGWGTWWSFLPCIEHRHDSLPALALGALVAWALVVHHRDLARRVAP